VSKLRGQIEGKHRFLSVMTTSATTTAFSSKPSQSSAVTELLNKQLRTHSDASSEVTAATSGSISSGEVDKYQNAFDDSPASKPAEPLPFTHDDEQRGDLTTMNRQNSGSLPDLRKAEGPPDEDQQDTTTSTFDMSDFACTDFYQADSLRNSDRKLALPDVPEESDIATPPSSLDPSLIVYPPNAMNIVVSPPSRGISPAVGYAGIVSPSTAVVGSMASSSSTVQSMELHTSQPFFYSAIGSLEKSPAPSSTRIKSSAAREFRSSSNAPAAARWPPQQNTTRDPMQALTEKPVPRAERRRKDGKQSQSERPVTTRSILHKSSRDTKTASAQNKVKIAEPKQTKRRGKKVTINKQTEEKFLPVSEAFTPREKKNIKYKPAEMRTPVLQKEGMGTLSRPNFRDALRRVAMIIRQHIEKIEHRFQNPNENANLFSPDMEDMFSDEQFVTPRYKCTMVRVPMARPGTVYGLRKIRLKFEIPTEEEIYEFGHQLFKSVQLSSECSIVCLIYVERLMEVAKVPLLSSTWKPIFMCGLLLASKVWQDLASWNIEFASVYPQYSLDAINRLELQFLRMVKWDLYISSRYVFLYAVPVHL
jgi:hypothetical protein